eukprot:gene7878-12347_t
MESRTRNGYHTLSFGYNATTPNLIYKLYKTPKLVAHRHVPSGIDNRPTHQLITNDNLKTAILERDWTTKANLLYFPSQIYTAIYFNKTNFYQYFNMNISDPADIKQKWRNLYVTFAVQEFHHPTNATIFADGYSDALTIKTTSMIDNYYYLQVQSRIELMHPSIYVISLLFLFLLLFLTLVFSCNYPLKLHGYIPFLSCFYLLVGLVGNFYQIVSDIEGMTNSCFLNMFIIIPLQVSLVVLIPIFQGRNIILWNLNAKKSLYVDSKKSDESQKLKVSYRILKFLKKSFVEVVISIAFALLLMFFGFILYVIPITSPYPFRCENIKITIIYILQNIIIAMLIIGIIILFIVDVIMAIRKALKQGLFILWKEDVFYLRFQLYFLGLGMTAPVFLFTFLTRIFFDYLGLTQLPGAELIIAALSTVSLWNLLFMQTIFVLLVTISKFVYVKLRTLCLFGGKKVKQKDFAYQLLEKKNIELKKIFRTYAESEFSVENLICFEDVQEYKKIKSFKDKQLKGLMIYHTYLNGDASELEINVGRKICQEIIAKLQHEPELKQDLFEKIEKQVVINLSDTFQRFFLTIEIEDYGGADIKDIIAGAGVAEKLISYVENKGNNAKPKADFINEDEDEDDFDDELGALPSDEE